MTVAALASGAHEVDDAFAANELFQRNGWTDGLPIVPPTAAGVRTFLDAGPCAPDDVVGVEPVNPDELGKRMQRDQVRWNELIRAVGIQPQ